MTDPKFRVGDPVIVCNPESIRNGQRAVIAAVDQPGISRGPHLGKHEYRVAFPNTDDWADRWYLEEHLAPAPPEDRTILR